MPAPFSVITDLPLPVPEDVPKVPMVLSLTSAHLLFLVNNHRAGLNQWLLPDHTTFYVDIPRGNGRYDRTELTGDIGIDLRWIQS